MKKSGLKYLICIPVILLALSCRKVIQLDLGNHTGELVIEANLTNVYGPQYVKISRNVPFTSTNTYPAVTGAVVSISDSLGHQYQFTEGPAGTYSIDNVNGIAGDTYHLSITTGGKTYTAKSTMPQVVKMDSITSKDSFFDTGKGKRMITVYFKDPPNVPNQYRMIMYVNGVQVKSVFSFSDEFIDGKYVNLDLQENDIDVYAKDTVKVEMQNIDKPMYTYWFTQAQQQANNPGGQVAPANPPTNITPTTLGYFSAHTTQSISLVVK
ncbi:MAG: DUF4249 domain-containing protein [Sphingobacteriales bacterium]